MESKKKLKDESYVSIIILNYNGGNTLLECIDSVFKTTDCKFEVILIDNKSSDESHLKCKEKYNDIILFQNEENLGLGARNIGIDKAKGDFIVFLDSDTIVEPDWLINLLNSLMKNGEGLYQPKLLEKDNHDIINSAGNMINIFGFGYSRGKGEKDEGQYEEVQQISYTSGACTFTSSTTINKIGKINELLFAYHDDLDYGWRARLQGIPSYYIPDSIVYHLGSPTLGWSKKKFYFLERNRWICLLYLYSTKTLLKLIPILIILELGILVYALSNGSFIEKCKSCFSIIKLQKKICQLKKENEKNSIIEDKEIIKNFTNSFFIPSIVIRSSYSKFLNEFVTFLSKIGRRMI